MISLSPEAGSELIAGTEVTFTANFNYDFQGYTPYMVQMAVGGVGLNNETLSGEHWVYKYVTQQQGTATLSAKVRLATSSGRLPKSVYVSVTAEVQGECGNSNQTTYLTNLSDTGPTISFDYISSQQTKTPFAVTLRAQDAVGASLASFNETVTVSSPQEASPTKVRFENGTATMNCTLLRPSSNAQLFAQGGGASGSSNFFAVTASVPETGSVQGRVVDERGNAVSGETVYLFKTGQSFQATATAVTDATGKFNFSDLSADGYDLYIDEATSGSASTSRNIKSRNVQVGAGKAVTLAAFVKITPQQDHPVVFIPDYMGSTSTYSPQANFSWLPREMPAGRSVLSIRDNNYKEGWTNLAQTLTSDSSYKIFPFAYDWRCDIALLASQLSNYLLELKEKYGYAKFDIVSHGMGGLVARYYLQNIYNPNDTTGCVIERFAMVGTPNHGAMHMYTIAEGADPLLAETLDNVTHDSLYIFRDNIFSRIDTTQALFASNFRRMFCNYALDGYIISFQDRMDFYNNYIPAYRWLLPTEGSATYANTKLKDLNDASSLSRIKTGGSVSTRIFASNSIQTVETYKVKPGSGTYYPDGIPTALQTTAPGDGLMPVSSVLLDGVDAVTAAKGDHFYLIDAFKDEIDAWLKAGRTGASAGPAATTAPAGRGEATTPRLYIRSTGATTTMAAFPGGAEGGIDGQFITEADGMTVTGSLDNTGIAADAQSGDLAVTLKNGEDGIATLEAMLDKDGTISTARWQFPVGTTSRVAHVAVDVANQSLTLADTLKPVATLTASNIQGACRLSWTAASGGAGYIVYRKKDDELLFQKLAETAATSLDTGDSWVSEGSSQYAVVVKDDLNTESAFSNVVYNMDLPQGTQSLKSLAPLFMLLRD